MKLLEHKETLLQFSKLSVPQIQNAFKSTEDSLALIFPEIIEIFKNLKIIYSENDERMILKPFLSIFQKESIKVESIDEYNHRILISIMILMCKSRDYLKARAIFEIFDVGHNDSLGPHELNYMLKSLLMTVDKLCLILMGENFNETDALEKIKNQIVMEIKKNFIILILLKSWLRS